MRLAGRGKGFMLALAFAPVLGAPAALASRWDHGICLFGLADVRDRPRFDDYPAAHTQAQRAQPRLTTASARLYRTVLRTQAARGPNFAGNQTIAIWGCGAGCSDFAIVDARSGRVFFADTLRFVSHFHVDDEDSLNFRRDSRLLVLLGAPREEESREGIYFLEWTGTGLRQLRFVPTAQLCRQT